jgi:hypothetical protein
MYNGKGLRGKAPFDAYVACLSVSQYTFAIPGLFHCPRNDVQWPRDVLSVSNPSESVNSDVGQQLDEEVTLELPMPLIDR